MSQSTRWTRRHILGAALATAAAGVVPGRARAATTLRWASVLPINHPEIAMAERVAKQMREQTSGEDMTRRICAASRQM